MADARTPQEAIEAWFIEDWRCKYLMQCLNSGTTPEPWEPHAGHRAQARANAELLLASFASSGYVIVACPVGERRVVDRTPQPCPECNGKGRFYEAGGWYGCRGACGGRGTVDSDRVLGLEPHYLTFEHHDEEGVHHPALQTGWDLVDLPEGQE